MTPHDIDRPDEPGFPPPAVPRSSVREREARPDGGERVVRLPPPFFPSEPTAGTAVSTARMQRGISDDASGTEGSFHPSGDAEEDRRASGPRPSGPERRGPAPELARLERRRTPRGPDEGLDPHVAELSGRITSLGEALRSSGEAALRVEPGMDRFDATLRAYCVGYLASRRRGEAP